MSIYSGVGILMTVSDFVNQPGRKPVWCGKIVFIPIFALDDKEILLSRRDELSTNPAKLCKN
jgi:hypothetical protein